MSELLEELVGLSRELGREEMNMAILGEGNSSADAGDGTFYVKASGSSLRTIESAGFTRVVADPVLTAIDDGESLSDDDVRRVLEESRFEGTGRLPSVETFLHALCLREAGAKWVGHVHPISVLSVLCSREGAKPFGQHVFPDGIVVCGRHLAVVPYVDPGIRLAMAVRDSLRAYMDQHGAPPRVILMENHGPVALGQSSKDVLNILVMLDKWARIIVGTSSLGGPRFLDDAISDRIDNRPDEHYRRQAIRS